MYPLRTAPCTDSPVLPLHDAVLRESLSVTLNVDLDDDRWRQTSLPLIWSGLGVRGVVLLALAALIYSLPPEAPWRSQPPSFQHGSTTSRTAASTPPFLTVYGMHHVRLRRQPRRHSFQQPNMRGTTHRARPSGHTAPSCRSTCRSSCRRNLESMR
jgi:hypothetical protein